jgi:hypothetical protein
LMNCFPGDVEYPVAPGCYQNGGPWHQSGSYQQSTVNDFEIVVQRCFGQEANLTTDEHG